MGYMKIRNLASDKAILQFKYAFALEKVDGTSAHIHFKRVLCHELNNDVEICELRFFSGCADHTAFQKLFNHEELKAKFLASGMMEMTIFGEAYGGKIQAMSATYGPNLKFVAFDVLHKRNDGDRWLGVEQANGMVSSYGLEFVAWNKIPATLEAIDFERDLPSRQAVRNGISEPKIAEGVVLRPTVEFLTPNGERIIAKHKRPEFSERSSKKDTNANDPAKQEVMANAQKIADEWVTPMRIKHVVNKLESILGHEVSSEDTKRVIENMIADVYTEGKGELVESREASRAIGKATAELFQGYLRQRLELFAAGG